MKTIEFTEIADGTSLGTVTLTDDGELVYSNESRRQAMAPMVYRVGEEKAFRWFTNWSNGYVESEVIDDDES